MTLHPSLPVEICWMHNQFPKLTELFGLSTQTQEPVAHWSDCAVHNEPAYPKGECDCGGIVAVADYTALSDKYVALKAQRTEQEPVAWMDVDGNVSDNNDHKCFPIPLYTQPPQRTEERSGWRKKQIDDAEEEAWKELEKKNGVD